MGFTVASLPMAKQVPVKHTPCKDPRTIQVCTSCLMGSLPSSYPTVQRQKESLWESSCIYEMLFLLLFCGGFFFRMPHWHDQLRSIRSLSSMPLFPGVYTRALHELFAVVDQREQTHKYHMKVSMVEIYNEGKLHYPRKQVERYFWKRLLHILKDIFGNLQSRSILKRLNCLRAGVQRIKVTF